MQRYIARGVIGAFASSLLALSACADEPTKSACVASIDASCSPLYEATFDQIYTRTLHQTCAVSGASCHSTEGAKAGLVFDDPDDAYARLLGQDGGAARVIPGDASCSTVIERLFASDPSLLMPPGSQLSEAERCDFVLWIMAGAKR